MSVDTALIGGTRMKKLPTAVIDLSNRYLIHKQRQALSQDMVQVFYRVEVHGQTFYSSEYSRVKRRNTYPVLYKDAHDELKFGQVQYYFIADQRAKLVLAVIKQLPVLQTSTCSVKLPYQCRSAPTEISVTDSLDITDLNSIQEKCLFIQKQPYKFVIRFPHADSNLISD